MNGNSQAGIAPKPVTPVSDGMASLERCQEHTLDLLTQLEDRLQTVLSPPPETAPSNSARSVGHSPLVEALIKRVESGTDANTRILSMLERLAL